MDITFQEYIDNPLGKKSAVFSGRDMFREMYTKKYGAVLLRENGIFSYALYYNKSKDIFVIHMKVPSEVVERFYYDVLIEFRPITAGCATDPTLVNYGVRFFSNDPAFVFTYEYVFNNNDLFIKELKSKASRTALRNKPDERNPYQTPGYVKSLYFCFLYMKSKSLFNKVHWKSMGQPLNWKLLIRDIEDSDKKVADRQRLGEETAKKKAAEKKKAEVEKKRQPQTTSKQSIVHNISGRNKTNTSSGIVNRIKPKKPIKGTKRLKGI